MRSPRTNPVIESIKARLKKEYLPDGNIPNSRVAKQIDLIDATATLEYAKSQNREVRRARPGECEATREREAKPKTTRHDPNKPNGMYSTKEAADKIGINVASLQERKRKTHITAVKVGSRLYYSEDEVYRLKAKLMKTA